MNDNTFVKFNIWALPREGAILEESRVSFDEEKRTLQVRQKFFFAMSMGGTRETFFAKVSTNEKKKKKIGKEVYMDYLLSFFSSCPQGTPESYLPGPGNSC